MLDPYSISLVLSWEACSSLMIFREGVDDSMNLLVSKTDYLVEMATMATFMATCCHASLMIILKHYIVSCMML